MYSVIILGATGIIGLELVKQFSVQKSHFKRLAFLTALADAGPEKEARYSKVEQQLERVVGSFSDPASYKGFDIVISVVGDDLCAQQHEFIDAAFAAGVKHFFPGECEFHSDLLSDSVDSYILSQLVQILLIQKFAMNFTGRIKLPHENILRKESGRTQPLDIPMSWSDYLPKHGSLTISLGCHRTRNP